MRPVGMVEARVQPLATVLALGQMLQQQAAGDPMDRRASRGEPHQAQDLLGLSEIACAASARFLPSSGTIPW